MIDFNKVYIIIIAVFSVAAVLILRLEYKRMAQKQYQGVKRLSLFKELLSSVQYHRGRTTAYLNQDEDAHPEIILLQPRIVHLINDVSKLAPELEDNERWQNITQHWARLSVNFYRNEKNNNLAQHNQLIQSILYLMDETVAGSGLLRLKSTNVKALRFLWQELLAAAEYVGQARAIGTGVLSAHYCNDKEKQQFVFLQQKIQEATRLAWHSLPASDSQRKQLELLDDCITEQFLNDTLTMSNRDYFDICTNVMDNLYRQYDETIKQFRVDS